MPITSLTLLVAITTVSLLALAGLLHLLPRLGAPGRAVSHQCQRAFGLDLLVTVFTMLPWALGAVLLGWWGVLGGVVAQLLAMHGWIIAHELAHRDAVRGPRIVKVLNSKFGRLRNHLAVWSTAPAVPLFWIVRVAQWTLYPPLVWLVNFPRYKQGEWVNVSRQKFEGLVGWDLIWCLYCDWMTGIWSLGTEMLRNVESFWCPIRFYSGKKCENCAIDFPDLEGGWVDAAGSMQQVADVLDQKYPSGEGKPNAWFGHPTRVTVEGEAVERDPGQTV
ncbi:MAG: hypothetical protein GVY24_00710 [Planctomycetes bacterium]|nr:hypothetical protein [Planctomycetota bacterium]